ncbi:MAG: bifunctional nicotinamidase/pyrazinamidase [Phycisphaerales bacterium]|nr:bifunctional nicotinamidase/pyrazinamidase [Phycisphaerales bacterium]
MKALILVDIQNDFLPGGALAVPRGNEVIAVANQLMEKFELVIATQDWHPANHVSFALWPVHCVQGSSGAELAAELNIKKIKTVIQKGTDATLDSYSGFFDNEHRKTTGLHEILQHHGVNEIYVMGLATDYCVKFTALDARQLGYTVKLVTDGCRGVELNPGDVEKSLAEMKAAGVEMVSSEEVKKIKVES